MLSIKISEKRILFIILVLALFLRAYGAFVFPYGAGPDEPTHYKIVQFVAQTGVYPAPDKSALDGSSPYYEAVQQPALYYFLASFLENAGKAAGLNPLLLIRLLNVLLGVFSVYLAFKLAKEVSQHLTVSLLTAAFVTFLPTHVVVSAVVNNGPLAWVLATASLWMMVKTAKKWNWEHALFVGALFGLAVGAKVTALCLLPAFALFAIVSIWKSRETFGKKMLAIALPFAIMAPVFVRNWLVYGELLPTQPVNVFSPGAEWAQYVFSHLFAAFFLQEYGSSAIPSYRIAFFAFWLGISLLALYGLAKHAKKIEWNSFLKKPSTLLLAAAGLNLLGIVYLNAKWLFPEGRLLFETLAVWALLLVLGLRWASQKYGTGLAIAMIASLAFMSIVLLANVYGVLPSVPWPVSWP